MNKINLTLLAFYSILLWSCSRVNFSEICKTGSVGNLNHKIKERFWLGKELWANPSQANGQPIIKNKEVARKSYNVINVPVMAFDPTLATYDTIPNVVNFLRADNKMILGIVFYDRKVFGKLSVRYYNRGLRGLFKIVKTMGAGEFPDVKIHDFINRGLINGCLYYNSSLNRLCFVSDGKTYLFNNGSEYLLEHYIYKEFISYQNFITKCVLEQGSN